MQLFQSSSKSKEKLFANAAMQACEAAIRELGADVHDDLIQRLSILRLHLDKLERSSYEPSVIRQAVVEMKAEFERTVESVRRISHRLHPIYSEGDSFEKKLELLCHNFYLPGSAKIHLFSSGPPQSLSMHNETHLLRMVQELIHNSIKHSSAWNIWIRLRWESKSVKIEVEDDGSACVELTKLLKKLEYKHNTLRMRAKAIGASIRYALGTTGLLAIIQLTTDSQ